MLVCVCFLVTCVWFVCVSVRVCSKGAGPTPVLALPYAALSVSSLRWPETSGTYMLERVTDQHSRC